MKIFNCFMYRVNLWIHKENAPTGTEIYPCTYSRTAANPNTAAIWLLSDDWPLLRDFYFVLEIENTTIKSTYTYIPISIHLFETITWCPRLPAGAHDLTSHSRGPHGSVMLASVMLYHALILPVQTTPSISPNISSHPSLHVSIPG